MADTIQGKIAELEAEMLRTRTFYINWHVVFGISELFHVLFNIHLSHMFDLFTSFQKHYRKE